jgi:hypothetical protein
MATNKTKRSIHLAQPQPQHAKNARAGDPKPAHFDPNPQPAELMPVRAHAYRTLAEMNNGLEQAIQGLDTLKRISYLSSGSLHGIHSLLSRVRAQANRELMAVLAERETTNAEHFQQLCLASGSAAR